MIVGMDFGTTNSGMARFDGRSVHLLPLDPDSPNPRVARTALYITKDQRVQIGRTAVDQYLEQNIGRPVKMRRVWVGEIEVIASEMYYVTDAYAWVDVLSPGRLFLSVKSSLRDETYAGTVIGHHFYPLETLIALYLTVTRQRAESQLGRELNQIVLGRPVHFATDPAHDQLAQDRLLQAAFQAGYEKVYLQPEPVAAAFSYENELDREQNVLVFDFGGGTLDLTVMRLGDPHRRRVLATGGIPVAGDIFDQKLVRAKLPRHFGETSYYGPRHKRLTMPRWIFDAFSDWQKILELQAAENRKILEDIARTAQRRYQIEALISLVSGNYGLKMFDVVERAKRVLSDKRGAEILLGGEGFQVRDFVTRTEFERIIGAEIRAIDDHVDEVVAESGLKPSDIDAVIRTGGSSQIPAFHEMLAGKFGAEKVQAVDTFSSVTAGLGIIGHGIEAGEIEARPFTPDTIAWAKPADEHRPNVPLVNLTVLQKRIALAERADEQAGGGAKKLALIVVGGQALAAAVPFAGEDTRLPEGVWTSAALAEMDEQLLLITTHYLFLLVTPRQLIEYQESGLKLTDIYRLEREETVCAAARWPEISTAKRMLLVTSAGMARPYPLNVLRENIEAPVPLRFDNRLPGVVIAVLAEGKADRSLVTISRKGRGVRFPVSRLRLAGVQVFNCGQDDRVTGAALVETEAELGLITADGYGRRFQVLEIPPAEKPNTKGRSLIARRSDVAGMFRLDLQPWLLASMGLVQGEIDQIPQEVSTKTRPLLKLAQGERIIRPVL